MEKIPEFPNFIPFTIKDIDWYKNYYLTNKLNPYADVNHENMLSWLNINNDLSISKIDSAVILQYTNILDKNQPNIIPLANPLPNSIIESMMAYLAKNNLPLELHEVPKVLCNELNVSYWELEDDRNSYEYILDTAQQFNMEGSIFYNRRRDLKIFERTHENDVIEVSYYEEFDDSLKEAFIEHISKHSLNSTEEAAKRNIVEPIAIRNNLKYANLFHKKAMIIKINGEIKSLSMISYLDKNVASINHIKVDYSIKDIFRYTVYQLAKALKERDIREMNFEQDLGIAGMRTFKEHLQPSRMLEKVTIRPKV